MKTRIEVLFTPADFNALAKRDISRSLCVVFDVLRATSTMLTALANDAAAVVPAESIPEALELRKQYNGALLAGERDGVRIRSNLTGSIDFDLGNSPREFTRDRVAGRTIVMTTTNGTRALRAASHARRVLVGGFLNLSAITADIVAHPHDELILVCSGTLEQASIEDALAAGAICDLLWHRYIPREIADSAQMARELYLAHRNDLLAAMRLSRNGRRLLGMPELQDDVPFCLQRDTIGRAAVLGTDGVVRFTNE